MYRVVVDYTSNGVVLSYCGGIRVGRTNRKRKQTIKTASIPVNAHPDGSGLLKFGIRKHFRQSMVQQRFEGRVIYW